MSNTDHTLSGGRESWLAWPRLYLDTGLLLEIGDGQTEERTLAHLLATMAELPALLVVSRDHMQDAVPRGDGRNRDKLAAAIERFPFRAVVDREPYEIEPWTEPSQDIGLRPIVDFAGLLKDPAAGPYLANLAAAQDRLHAAAAATQVARRVSPELSQAAGEIAFACMITLARRWMGNDVPEILAMWETERKSNLTEDERASIIATLTPWATLLGDHDRQYPPTEGDGETMLQGFSAGFEENRMRSPGMYLAARLTRCWQRDLARNPRRSDSVDGMHASYFPYVDIATCDGSTFACLARHIGSVRGPRRPKVFRNNDLASLIETLASGDFRDRTAGTNRS